MKLISAHRSCLKKVKWLRYHKLPALMDIQLHHGYMIFLLLLEYDPKHFLNFDPQCSILGLSPFNVFINCLLEEVISILSTVSRCLLRLPRPSKYSKRFKRVSQLKHSIFGTGIKGCIGSYQGSPEVFTAWLPCDEFTTPLWCNLWRRLAPCSPLLL